MFWYCLGIVDAKLNCLLFFIGCTGGLFTIESTAYGDVYYYGVVGKLNILQFTKRSKSYFCFTCNKALKEVKSGKCIRGVASSFTSRQLVLDDKCDKTWTYSPTKKRLVYVESGKCLSPWNYRYAKLAGVTVVPGLSTCSSWNKISLNGKFLVSSFVTAEAKPSETGSAEESEDTDIFS